MNEIFNKMKSIVEAPGYKYLQSYKKDFYEHDAKVINEELAEGSRYLWVVGPSGTHLTRLGVHEKQDEWAKATVTCGMSATNLGVETYLVTTAGVKKISDKQAIAEIAKKDYLVKGDLVQKSDGTPFASFDIKRIYMPGCAQQLVDAHFTSISAAMGPEISGSDARALRDIALGEASKLWGSAFVGINSITLNGEPLFETEGAQEEARQRESAAG